MFDFIMDIIDPTIQYSVFIIFKNSTNFQRCLIVSYIVDPTILDNRGFLNKIQQSGVGVGIDSIYGFLGLVSLMWNFFGPKPKNKSNKIQFYSDKTKNQTTIRFGSV